MRILRLSWLGTRTQNYEPTVSFFRDVLQLPVQHLVLPIQRSEDGAWLHFRAPDGHLYELSEGFSSSS